jgi:hypothetical protein
MNSCLLILVRYDELCDIVIFNDEIGIFAQDKLLKGGDEWVKAPHEASM